MFKTKKNLKKLNFIPKTLKNKSEDYKLSAVLNIYF